MLTFKEFMNEADAKAFSQKDNTAVKQFSPQAIIGTDFDSMIQDKFQVRNRSLNFIYHLYETHSLIQVGSRRYMPLEDVQGIHEDTLKFLFANRVLVKSNVQVNAYKIETSLKAIVPNFDYAFSGKREYLTSQETLFSKFPQEQIQEWIEHEQLKPKGQVTAVLYLVDPIRINLTLQKERALQGGLNTAGNLVNTALQPGKYQMDPNIR